MDGKIGRVLVIIVVSIFVFASFGSTINQGDAIPGLLDANLPGPDVSLLSLPEPEPLASGKVCVLVEPSKYVPLQNELLVYKNDLEAEGYTVEIRTDAWADHVTIRTFLTNEWQSNGLVGCVIVGDLPYAWYEIHDDFDEPGIYSLFPIDHYYTDLDGTWVDLSPVNGIYDDHTDTGPTDLEPEIWLGRITIDSEWEDEVKLIGNYFNKTHEYRMGNLSLPHEALLYVDDDWVGSALEWSTDISALYPNRTVETDVYVTNATDYAQRVQEGYEWIQVHCHANHSPVQHAFMLNDGVKGSGGNFRSSNLSQDGQKSLFSNVFTCGSANYTNADYLCGWYIFTETYGLCSIGSTKPGAMLNFGDFYDPLAAGDCIGDAFKYWFSNTAEYLWGVEWQDYARSWFYGMTIIGDPTLSPLLEDVNPPANVTDLGISLDDADIVLNWTVPVTPDVSHYLIYRATTHDGFDFGLPHGIKDAATFTVINETVYGPSIGGEIGPIYLVNSNIINCTLYVDIEGEWIWLEENSDYTLDYVTGEIDITPIAPMDPNWTFHAFYNTSFPSTGQIWVDIGAGMGDGQNYFYIVRAVDYGSNVETNENTVGKWVTSTSEGWNLISTPLLAENTTTECVFQSLEWDSARWYDGQGVNLWSSYSKTRPSYFNDLLSVDHTMGVWVQVDIAGELITVGHLPGSIQIDLMIGWNLVGYPSLSSANAADTLPIGVDRVAVFDAGMPYLIRDETDISSVTMQPGEGYWVHVDSNTVWNVG